MEQSDCTGSDRSKSDRSTFHTPYEKARARFACLSLIAEIQSKLKLVTQTKLKQQLNWRKKKYQGPKVQFFLL